MASPDGDQSSSDSQPLLVGAGGGGAVAGGVAGCAAGGGVSVKTLAPQTVQNVAVDEIDSPQLLHDGIESP